MNVFTYTKLSVEARNATLATVIANINDPSKGATDGVGKASAVRVFGDARITGQINDDQGQVIGRAIYDDLTSIANNPKRSDKNRNNAAKAIVIFDQFRRDFHASKQPQAEVTAAPVVVAVAPVVAPNAAMAPAASLTDLTAMVMSLTASVNTLLANA